MNEIKDYDSMMDIEEECWRKKRPPYVGGMELTPFCNLKCVHCYLQDCHKKDLMTTEEVKSIIDQLYDEGVLILYFTGGEIFTRPDFMDIYVYA